MWFTILLVTILPVLMFTGKRCEKIEGKKDYSGIVKYRYQDELRDKGNDVYSIQKKLIVKFDSVEKTKEILVTADTYFSVKVGQRVTFNMTNQDMGKISAGYQIVTIFCCIILIANVLALLVFMIIFIVHVFNNYNLKFVNINIFKLRKEIDPYGEEDWDK